MVAVRGYQCGGSGAGVAVQGSGRAGVDSAGVRARGHQCGGQGAVDARGGGSAGAEARV